MTGFVRKQSMLYRCPKHYNGLPSCSNQRSISHGTLEKYLLQNIKHRAEERIKKVAEEQKKRPDNRKKIATLEKKLERLKDLYVEGLIEIKEYKKDRETYLAEIESLSAEPSAPEPDLTTAKKILEMDIESSYAMLASNEDKRYFWRSILKEIRFGKDRNIEVVFL